MCYFGTRLYYIKACGLHKPSHCMDRRHSMLSLARHLANGDLNYVFPILAMQICANLTTVVGRTKIGWSFHDNCGL